MTEVISPLDAQRLFTEGEFQDYLFLASMAEAGAIPASALAELRELDNTLRQRFAAEQEGK